MKSLGMTAGNDNDLIQIIVIHLDNSTVLRMCDRVGGIELTNTYTGDELCKDSLRTNKSFNLNDGGGSGEVGVIDFIISGLSSNAIINDAWDDFYPNTDFVLNGSKIQYGVAWEGATTDADITWLEDYYVHDYEVVDMSLVIFGLERMKESTIPFYVVQKELEDGVSYWENAVESSYGEPIPILFGDWSFFLPQASDETIVKLRLAPTLNVDRYNLIYIVACHEIYETVTSSSIGSGEQVYKYLSELDTCVLLTPDNGAVVNDFYGSWSRLLSNSFSSGDQVLGEIWLHPKTVGWKSEVVDISNVFTAGEHIVLDTGVTAGFRLDEQSENSILGTLSSSSAHITLIITYASFDSNSADVKLHWWNEQRGGYSGIWATYNTVAQTSVDFDFGATTTYKTTPNLPWTLSELSDLSFLIKNDSGGSQKMELHNVYLHLQNIILHRILPERKKIKVQFPHVRLQLRL